MLKVKERLLSLLLLLSEWIMGGRGPSLLLRKYSSRIRMPVPISNNASDHDPKEPYDGTCGQPT